VFLNKSTQSSKAKVVIKTPIGEKVIGIGERVIKIPIGQGALMPQ